MNWLLPVRKKNKKQHQLEDPCNNQSILETPEFNIETGWGGGRGRGEGAGGGEGGGGRGEGRGELEGWRVTASVDGRL